MSCARTLRRMAPLLWGALALVPASCRGCLIDDPTPKSCPGQVSEACTEDWCDMIEREYCEPRAAACRIDGGKTDDHCLIQGCLDGVAQRVRAASDPTQAANALSACALGNVKNDGGCPGFELCVDPDAGAEAGPPDATVLNAPSQVVALPGDKLGCIDCARTECSSEACLPTSPDGAQLSTRRDDCLNYRACLRACAQGYGMGRHEYAACAATTCDTRFDAGVKQFQSFRSCLVKSCAGCGGG